MLAWFPGWEGGKAIFPAKTQGPEANVHISRKRRRSKVRGQAIRIYVPVLRGHVFTITWNSDSNSANSGNASREAWDRIRTG